MKKIVYLDMDGVMADFKKGVGRPNPEWSPPEMYLQGFFRNLPVMAGAREAITEILTYEGIDLYIASKPDSINLFCATEKYQWIQEHFPELIKKIFLTCDKGHLNGHFLVDDDERQWKDKFKGEFIKFDELNPEASWKAILETLKPYK